MNPKDEFDEWIEDATTGMNDLTASFRKVAFASAAAATVGLGDAIKAAEDAARREAEVRTVLKMDGRKAAKAIEAERAARDAKKKV